jgi:predicted peptidase
MLFGASASLAYGQNLAPGAPQSPERQALITAFQEKARALGNVFEVRMHAVAMPYRLFKPAGSGKRPLILYMHGAGGIGSDNLKQIAGGNVPGSHVWALPENQKRFPCYIVAPQTDKTWIRMQAPRSDRETSYRPVAGLGEGAAIAVQIVRALMRELPIDEQRIYVVGNSMGGGAVWNLVANEPSLFAAAIPFCGTLATETGAESPRIPLWAFHGAADSTVPVSVTRRRVEARRKAGGKPLYTEYAGVGHNVALWACTEPALPEWLFSQRR